MARALKTTKVKAEIPSREWMEFEIHSDDNGVIQQVEWHAFGCQPLLDSALKLAGQLKLQSLDKSLWGGAAEHWDILAREILAKLKGTFEIPVSDPELCHCRKIPTQKVDEAIVLGAHTPEKVRAWTTASSGCGTCRPEVEKLIEFRLKKV